MAMQESPRLILLLGGARSGKSAYAEQLAGQLAGDAASVLYIATATPSDDEMRERITRHQASRPPHWHTIEEPTNPADALRASAESVALLDCMTLLVANLMLDGDHGGAFDEATLDAVAAQAEVDAAITRLLDVWRSGRATLIVVSNEVGMGLVPPYPLGRVYRDILGRVNARLAAAADTVLLMVAGLPIELKALAAAWEREATQRLGDS